MLEQWAIYWMGPMLGPFTLSVILAAVILCGAFLFTRLLFYIL